MSNKLKVIAPLDVALALDPLAASYTIPGVGAQSAIGDAGKNTLSTGSGRDYLNGGLGADTINAGTGDDYISNLDVPSLSGDRIDGGLGFDELGINFSASSKGVSFTAFDPARAKSLLGASIVNVERFNLTGSNHADTFLGGRWKDWFVGGAGNDTLKGEIGDDWIDAGDGDWRGTRGWRGGDHTSGVGRRGRGAAAGRAAWRQAAGASRAGGCRRRHRRWRPDGDSTPPFRLAVFIRLWRRWQPVFDRSLHDPGHHRR